MLCAIWYHLYNSKNMKNTHGGVLLLVKLQDSDLRLQMVPNHVTHLTYTNGEPHPVPILEQRFIQNG